MICNLTKLNSVRSNFRVQNAWSSIRTYSSQLDPNEENESLSVMLKKIKEELVQDKKRLEWRQQFGAHSEDWNSKLKLFSNSNQTSDFITMMQQPIDLRPKAIKRWWEKQKVDYEKHLQQYLQERHEMLGNELAAAHFLLHRGGAVRFVHDANWMRADENNEFDLPKSFHPKYKIQGIRCDGMTLYYEGLENIRLLHNLKFLSFHNVKTFDDWCLDRISGAQYPTLEVLDISGTDCSPRGLSCIYRIPTLRLLIIDDPKKTLEYELTCAMLEEAIPKLRIVASNAVHDL